MGIYPHTTLSVKSNVTHVEDKQGERILQMVSQQMRLAREGANMSKLELSKLSGVDRATIRYIENPEENPTILTLIKVAIALDIDLGSIISQCFEEVEDA